MSKKLLCVLLSAIMIFGTMAVMSTAVDTDYKDLIDREFLTGRLTNKMMVVPEQADKESVRLENLKYWNSEIQSAYANAKNNADYEALYNEMKTPVSEKYENYWYKNRNEANGKVNLELVTDVTNVKAKDTIVVTGKMTMNFASSFVSVGLAYDKEKLNFKSIEVVDEELFESWMPTVNKTFGYKTEGGQLVDYRASMWPVSMRNQASYDKYEIVNLRMLCNDPEHCTFNTIQFENDEQAFKAVFTVKDTVKNGDVIDFYVPNDCDWSSDRLEDYPKDSSSMFGFSRVNAYEFPYKTVDNLTSFDHTYTIKNASVQVGNVDTSALKAAIDAFDAKTAADYTAASWTAYENAVNAGKDVYANPTTQEAVDNATDAITTAAGKLAENNIISASQISKASVGSETSVVVKATGSPEQIRLVNDANTISVNRTEALIQTVGDSETWTFNVYVQNDNEEYKVYANYGSGFHSSYVTLAITTSAQDLRVYSVKVADMWDDYHEQMVDNNGVVKFGKHNVEIQTSTDAWKVQFIDKDGNTVTFSSSDKSVDYSDNNGVRTWHIWYNFVMDGDFHLDIRTRSFSTTFYDTGADLDAFVLI